MRLHQLPGPEDPWHHVQKPPNNVRESEVGCHAGFESQPQENNRPQQREEVVPIKLMEPLFSMAQHGQERLGARRPTHLDESVQALA